MKEWHNRPSTPLYKRPTGRFFMMDESPIPLQIHLYIYSKTHILIYVMT